MATHALTNSTPPPLPHRWQMLLLLALLLLLLSFLLPTRPPDEVAIDLTEVQLLDLTTAYEQGFDHPDPEQDDACERLRLLPHKKLSAWKRQFQRRGFTMDKIRNMLRTGRREVSPHPTKDLTYTRIYDQQGNWIVVDFVDCIIWQVAPYNFK